MAPGKMIAVAIGLGAAVGMIGFCVLQPSANTNADSVISFDAACLRDYLGANDGSFETAADCEIGRGHAKAIAKAFAGVPLPRPSKEGVRAPETMLAGTLAAAVVMNTPEGASDLGKARATAIEMSSSPSLSTSSSDYCSRRDMMARAAMVAGAMVGAPAFAAEAKVQMGSDAGQLVYVPASVTVCKGDSITWVLNKAGPHNVVFDPDNVPAGVDTDTISKEETMGDEGDTFTTKLDVAGTYGYYCSPHRGAGMQGTVVVK
jgi:plastocyanin